MPTILVPVETKRPADATPEKILRLRETGLSVTELVKLYGVNRARIYQLLERARKARERTKGSASPI